MIITNDKEFEEFFPYPKKYIKNYPKEYPCICRRSLEGGGLTGEYYNVYVTYFPKNVTPNEAFLIGLNPHWELLP